MTTRDSAVTVVQYGIRTPNSKTILMVTEDLSEAQNTIDMFGSGTLITRTVRYSAWQDLEEGLDAAV